MSIQINLLPDIVLKRRKEAQIRSWATSGLIAWIVVVLVITMTAFLYKTFQDARLASANSSKKKLDAVVNSKDNVAFRKEALSVQLSLKALDDLYNKQQKMTLINKRLAELTPKQVRLSSVGMSGGKILLSCSGASYSDAAKFLVSLKDSSQDMSGTKVTFSDIKFSGANLSTGGVSFSITATVNYPTVVAVTPDEAENTERTQ